MNTDKHGLEMKDTEKSERRKRRIFWLTDERGKIGK
jgi:hypothetical protein